MRTGSIILLVWLSLFTGLARSAPPVLNWFFPSGGQQGTTVSVKIGGTFPEWPPQIWCDSKDISLNPTEKNTLSIKLDAKATPGPKLIRFTNKDGASAIKAFWVGNIPEIEEKEPNDSHLKPQALEETPVLINGKLGAAGDSDTFAIKAKSGQVLVAKLQGNQGLESPMDAVLQILSPEGFIVAENHDRFGTDPFIAFPVPSEGIYKVRLFAFPATPDSSIRFSGGETYIYRLTLTTGPYLDHTMPLVISTGKANSLNAKGWNLKNVDTKINAKMSDENKTVAITMKGVAGFISLPSTTNPTEEITNLEKPLQIDSPKSISGVLQKPSRHEFELKFKKGAKHLIKVEARNIGSDLDPILILKDSQGKELKRVDDEDKSRDTSLEVNPTDDKPLKLFLADLHNHFGETFYYKMDVTSVVPDFELEIDSDAYVSKDAKPVEIPLKIIKKGGFTGDITVQAIGLPNGWTAENLQINSKTASPAKLTLKPSEKAEPGFFKVEATSGTTKKTISRNVPSLQSTVEVFYLSKETKDKK